MNKTDKLAFLCILLLVGGCSKQSQVQPAVTGSKPSVVQAAAPAAPEAPATPPEPALDAEEKAGE